MEGKEEMERKVRQTGEGWRMEGRETKRGARGKGLNDRGKMRIYAGFCVCD